MTEGTDHKIVVNFHDTPEFKAWSARPPPFHPRADLTDPPGQSPFGWVVLLAGRACAILEACEHPLDQITLAIECLVVGDRSAPTGRRGDDGFGAVLHEQLTQTVGVIGLVGNEAPDRTCCGEQRGSERDIVDVARREQKDARATLGIGQGMDFCRPPAARAADRFAEGPPFPPAAERCALIWELSIATVP